MVVEVKLREMDLWCGGFWEEGKFTLQFEGNHVMGT